MEKFLCIHGHFYQPPRENPWLEAIEVQESSYPYHDWNERITSECYAPNVAARTLNAKSEIIEIVNNYSKINFNFGPTLLSWLQTKSPEVYQAVLDADEESRRRYSGHGSAISQAYNHMIMPLANRQDKITQVVWGIKDFESRFGRRPEGMWLPETAVDLETLDIMAEQGLKFTILDALQAKSVRIKGDSRWSDVERGKIDTTRPYEILLPSGRTFDIFFYEGPVARAVAFERLLNNGEVFAKQLLNLFSDKRDWPQLVHIANDGETYGHHHRYGEMALAYALHFVEANNLAKLTNYGEFLANHPPTHEVQVLENTSWSCAHGVERWRSGCGCNTGAHPEWSQNWRKPLRDAMDWLRDELIPLYQAKAKDYFRNPWDARNAYISVILNRGLDQFHQFLGDHAHHVLNEAEKITVLKLLELERHAMLMYTSCGWFFDDLTGIETLQIIQYAARTLQLAQDIFNEDLETEFVSRLAQAKSNIPEVADGRNIYEKQIKPSKVDLLKVGAHYAISSLFETKEGGIVTYSYKVEREDCQIFEAGKAVMAAGRIKVKSNITLEAAHLVFGVLHQGDHNLSAGVREYQGQKDYDSMVKEMKKAFTKGETHEVIRLMERHFGSSYSLQSLFKDEQRTILNAILKTSMEGANLMYRQIYEHNASLLNYLIDAKLPVPKELLTAAEFVLNDNLRAALESDDVDLKKISVLIKRAMDYKISLDVPGLSYSLEKALRKTLIHLKNGVNDIKKIKLAREAGDLLTMLPFEVNLWKVQNDYYILLKKQYPALSERAKAGDPVAKDWLDAFKKLGQNLYVQLPH